MNNLVNKMKWFNSFTTEEIEDMEKLLLLLDPMERLFIRFESQSESTIHFKLERSVIEFPKVLEF